MVKMLLLFTKIIFCLPPMHCSILQILFDPQLSQKSTRSLMKLPVNPYCPLMPLSPPNLLKTSVVLVWHELWPDRYRLTFVFIPCAPTAPKTSIDLSVPYSLLCLSGGKESLPLIYQEEFCFMVLLHICFNQ